jgi:hypothetical protein
VYAKNRPSCRCLNDDLSYEEHHENVHKMSQVLSGFIYGIVNSAFKERDLHSHIKETTTPSGFLKACAHHINLSFLTAILRLSVNDIDTKGRHPFEQIVLYMNDFFSENAFHINAYYQTDTINWSNFILNYIDNMINKLSKDNSLVDDCEKDDEETSEFIEF